jgi:SulP family sulfate permease
VVFSLGQLYDAGAQTPWLGVHRMRHRPQRHAAGPVLHNLPQADGRLIIVADAELGRPRLSSAAWRYSRPDGVAQLATIVGVLLIGVGGIPVGVGLAVAVSLAPASRT